MNRRREQLIVAWVDIVDIGCGRQNMSCGQAVFPLNGFSQGFSGIWEAVSTVQRVLLLSNTWQWRNDMFSVLLSIYARCCPDFRPLVLLSQEPSVYVTEAGRRTGVDFKRFNRKPLFQDLLEKKILLVTFSFLTVPSEMWRILNASLGIQMPVKSYKTSSHPPQLPLLDRSCTYTSFHLQTFVCKWHSDALSGQIPLLLKRMSCTMFNEGCSKEYCLLFHYVVPQNQSKMLVVWQ